MRNAAAPRIRRGVRLANVVLSSPDAESAAAGAERAVAWLSPRLESSGRGAVEVVGPAPAPIERLHGRWRWHFLLRAGSAAALTDACRSLVEGFSPAGTDVRLALDRDPVALL